MVALTLLTLMYVATMFAAVFLPRPHQLECEQDARIRGWSKSMIILTRGSQHFTIYAQVWLIAALATGQREFACIAMVLGTVVFFLYHVLMFDDPQHLSYEPESFVAKIIAWTPPRDRFIIPWIGIRVQHIVLPLYFWVTGGVEHHPEDVMKSVYAAFAYHTWSLVCWTVQGKPAYPIQERLWNEGGYIHAFIGCMALTYLVASGCDLLF